MKLDVTEADMDWFDLRVLLDVSDTTLTRRKSNCCSTPKALTCGWTAKAGVVSNSI